jgi:hypothetical protein
MSFQEQWKTAKTKFQTATLEKKPSEKVKGAFSGTKGTGVNAALKEMDAAKTVKDATSALAKFVTASEEYYKVLDKAITDPTSFAKKADADTYKAAAQTLQKELMSLRAEGKSLIADLDGKEKKAAVDLKKLADERRAAEEAQKAQKKKQAEEAAKKAQVDKFVKFRNDFVAKLQAHSSTVQDQEARAKELLEAIEKCESGASKFRSSGNAGAIGSYKEVADKCAKELSTIETKAQTDYGTLLKGPYDEHRDEKGLLSKWQLTAADVTPHLQNTWKQMEKLRVTLDQGIKAIQQYAKKAELACDNIASLTMADDQKADHYAKAAEKFVKEATDALERMKQLAVSSSALDPDERRDFVNNKYKERVEQKLKDPEDTLIGLARNVLNKLDDYDTRIDAFYDTTIKVYAKLSQTIPAAFQAHAKVKPQYDKVEAVVNDIKVLKGNFEQGKPKLENHMNSFIAAMENKKKAAVKA